MILHRCSSMLNSCKLSSPPKVQLLLSHLKRYSSLPFLYNSSSSPLPSSSSSSSSCSPLRIRLLLLNLNQQQQPLRPGRTRAFTAAAVAAHVVDGKESTDTFFAEEGVSWNSVGISDDRLSRALSTVGIDRPSLVQAACIPPILSGKDVVIAAETGSGKTYAYLVPLFEQVFSAVNDFENTHGQGFSLPGNITLVLCPNVMLCEQVVRMANGLCGDDGKPLLSVAAVCGRQGWPITIPDIIVSTPAALLNNLRSIDPERRRRSDFIRGVKYVVFDEADLLLCGSFQNQVIRLIDMLRFDEKQLSRMKKSMPEGSVELDSDTLLQFDSEDEEHYLQAEIMSEGEENLEGGDDVKHVPEDVEDVPEETESGSFKRKDWRRERKIYQRSKQYIFVAATLPVNGKKTAGGILKRMFPEADWVSGVYLHCHNPRLEQQWVEVTIEKQVDALIDAVNQGVRSKAVDPSSGVSRTIVFANTVEAVQAVAKILQGAGIECFCYHSDSSLEERAQTLVDFQQKGGILVCTDAASRGLDISNVAHVIQADFASSALDFLHRVGRTARAGQYGLVTSLYTESNKDLVGAIREAWKLGQPVEMAFSRKRSFRKKLKKRVAANRVGDTSTLKERVLA